MESFARKISKYFYRRNYINEHQIEDLRFGIEVVLSNLASLISIVILGFILKRTIDSFLFILIFCIARTLRNTYHAPTFLQCYILTVGSFLLSYAVSIMIIPEFYTPFLNYAIGLNVVLLYFISAKSNNEVVISFDFFVGFFILSQIIIYMISLNYIRNELIFVVVVFSTIAVSSNKSLVVL